MTWSTGRWVPVGLVALAAIPRVAGTTRLVEILGGPELIPTDARFAASPAPVVVHVAAAIGYTLLGASQFSGGIHRRHPRWHRRRDGSWSPLVSRSPLGPVDDAGLPSQKGTGDLLYGFRLLFGSGLAACLVVGVAAVRHGNIARHSAWMTRAYAVTLGAGTQAFTVGFGGAAFAAGLVRSDLMMGAGWSINLAVAE